MTDKLSAMDELSSLRALLEMQAEDRGLWFQAETIAEAYLQSELRKLHAAVELRMGPGGSYLPAAVSCDNAR